MMFMMSFFKWPGNRALCRIDVPHFLYPLFCWVASRLFSVWLWWIKLQWTWLIKCFCVRMECSLGTKCGIAKSGGTSIPNFMRTFHFDFYSGQTILHSNQQFRSFSPYSIYCPAWAVSCIIDINQDRVSKEFLFSFSLIPRMCWAFL